MGILHPWVPIHGVPSNCFEIDIVFLCYYVLSNDANWEIISIVPILGSILVKMWVFDHPGCPYIGLPQALFQELKVGSPLRHFWWKYSWFEEKLPILVKNIADLKKFWNFWKSRTSRTSVWNKAWAPYNCYAIDIEEMKSRLNLFHLSQKLKELRKTGKISSKYTIFIYPPFSRVILRGPVRPPPPHISKT